MSDPSAFRLRQLRVLHPARIILSLVPKAGNTSLRHAIHYAIGRPGSDLKETDDSIRIGKALSPKEPIPQDYLKLIMVRNPWERLRSCYTDKIAAPRGHPNRDIGAGFTRLGCWRGMPFNKFVRVIHATSDYEVEKHAMPVHYLLNNPLLGGGVDAILYLERPHDYRNLRAVFASRGLQLPDQMPRANHSDRTPKPRWTPETIRLVGERYADDIRLLGYEAPTC